jgi:hypothetical protein
MLLIQEEIDYPVGWDLFDMREITCELASWFIPEVIQNNLSEERLDECIRILQNNWTWVYDTNGVHYEDCLLQLEEFVIQIEWEEADLPREVAIRSLPPVYHYMSEALHDLAITFLQILWTMEFEKRQRRHVQG